MPACVVTWCRSHTRLNCPGITFHYFPTNPFRQKEWIAAVKLERQEPNWMPVKTSRVCSMHFDEKDFYKSSKGYTMLHKSAVPVCTMVRPGEILTSFTTENKKLNNNEPLQLANEKSPCANFEDFDLPELLNRTNTPDPQLYKAQKRELMFCLQEKESHFDKDPLDMDSQSDSDEEPSAKRLKINSSLNLQVYQIPAFNTPKSLSIFPSSPVLPKFVNNPLNLANPLALANEANNIVKNLQTRFSLPAKLTITPVQSKTPLVTETGEVIRYKKNGEIAKKRGPPKGYKRKPKVDHSQSFSFGSLHASALQAQNTILTSLLASQSPSCLPPPPSNPIPTPRPPPIDVVPPPPAPPVILPEGVELVELELDPSDWFPEDPYKMTFSRKKNPKWKLFPYRCEHCFKGYRVPSTLVQHAAERHGSVPRQLAVPCPCCPHVSTARKQHKKHLESHGGRRRRIFCVYCLPPPDPSQPYIKESEKYPFDKCPQYWYASEESLRLHKKRKHPYSGMFNTSWFCTWRDILPNS